MTSLKSCEPARLMIGRIVIPGDFEIDEELREPLVLLVGDDRGAEERDRVLAAVGVARPHLGAVDDVAAVRAHRPRADRGEVRARVRLAHADGERELAAHDLRQEALALGLGAEAQQQRPALALRHPVRAGRRPGRQQLLEQHVALQERALLPAVTLGPRQPDPPARAELAAELGIVAAPRARPPDRRPVTHLRANEGADLVPEGLGLGWQGEQLEVENAHGGDSISTAGPPPQP